MTNENNETAERYAYFAVGLTTQESEGPADSLEHGRGCAAAIFALHGEKTVNIVRTVTGDEFEHVERIHWRDFMIDTGVELKVTGTMLVDCGEHKEIRERFNLAAAIIEGLCHHHGVGAFVEIADEVLARVRAMEVTL